MQEKNYAVLNGFIPSFLIFLVINILLIYGIVKIGEQKAIEVKSIITRTVLEFQEPDLSYLCAITNCSYIALNDKLYELTEGGFLKKHPNDFLNNDVFLNFKNSAILTNYQIKVEADVSTSLDDYNIVVLLDKEIHIEEVIQLIITVNVFVQFLYFIFVSVLYYTRKKQMLLYKLQLSSSLQEKNMKILTENVHHEINTPLAVITGTIEQQQFNRQVYEEYTQRPFEERNKREEKYLHNNAIVLEYDILYSSIDQINNILQRMNGFKQIRYSNGNKSIKDIIDYSINSMTIYKHGNFDYKIAHIFNKYSLSGNLENGDFLNILSNFLRNSLEAKANFLNLSGKFAKGKFHMYIADNGEGIYNKYTNEHLNKKDYSRIFDPYYSTKDALGNKKIVKIKWYHRIQNIYKILFLQNGQNGQKNKETRGIGLYLNKQLLLEKHGNVFLKETSHAGTVFELIFDAKLKHQSRNCVTGVNCITCSVSENCAFKNK